MRCSGPFFFCLLLSSSLCAQLPTLQWGPVIDVDQAGEGGLRPRLTLNSAGNPVVIWGRNAPDRNYVAIGEGSSFSAPIEVSMAGVVPSVAEWMGSSIASEGDTIWVVMKATPEESQPIYVRRSDDGGYTWSDTLRVDPSDGTVSRFPSIDIAEGGIPLVQYMQFTSGWNGARQVVTRLAGDAFGPPVPVSEPFTDGEVCDCCPGQVVAEGATAVALYRNAASNLRVIWGASSSDGGATFPNGGLLDGSNWVISSCPSSGPDGYLAGDSIRFVWMTGASNGTKVNVASVHVDDMVAGTRRLVFPGQPQAHQQNFPRIDGNGDTLGVVWESYIGGQREILFSWSVTGTAGLSVPDTVNVELTGAQRTPDLAYANGSFHMVWDEGSTDRLRYRKATLVGANTIGERTLTGPTVWPVPVVERLHWSNNTWTSARITDALGRVVLEQDAHNGWLDVHHLPAGAYLLQLHSTGLGWSPGSRFIKQ